MSIPDPQAQLDLEDAEFWQHRLVGLQADLLAARRTCQERRQVLSARVAHRRDAVSLLVLARNARDRPARAYVQDVGACLQRLRQAQDAESQARQAYQAARNQQSKLQLELDKQTEELTESNLWTTVQRLAAADQVTQAAEAAEAVEVCSPEPTEQPAPQSSWRMLPVSDLELPQGTLDIVRGLWGCYTVGELADYLVAGCAEKLADLNSSEHARIRELLVQVSADDPVPLVLPAPPAPSADAVIETDVEAMLAADSDADAEEQGLEPLADDPLPPAAITCDTLLSELPWMPQETAEKLAGWNIETVGDLLDKAAQRSNKSQRLDQRVYAAVRGTPSLTAAEAKLVSQHIEELPHACLEEWNARHQKVAAAPEPTPAPATVPHPVQPTTAALDFMAAPPRAGHALWRVLYRDRPYTTAQDSQAAEALAARCNALPASRRERELELPNYHEIADETERSERMAVWDWACHGDSAENELNRQRRLLIEAWRRAQASTPSEELEPSWGGWAEFVVPLASGQRVVVLYEPKPHNHTPYHAAHDHISLIGPVTQTGFHSHFVQPEDRERETLLAYAARLAQKVYDRHNRTAKPAKTARKSQKKGAPT